MAPAGCCQQVVLCLDPFSRSNCLNRSWSGISTGETQFFKAGSITQGLSRESWLYYGLQAYIGLAFLPLLIRGPLGYTTQPARSPYLQRSSFPGLPSRYHQLTSLHSGTIFLGLAAIIQIWVVGLVRGYIWDYCTMDSFRQSHPARGHRWMPPAQAWGTSSRLDPVSQWRTDPEFSGGASIQSMAPFRSVPSFLLLAMRSSIKYRIG